MKGKSSPAKTRDDGTSVGCLVSTDEKMSLQAWRALSGLNFAGMTNPFFLSSRAIFAHLWALVLANPTGWEYLIASDSYGSACASSLSTANVGLMWCCTMDEQSVLALTNSWGLPVSSLASCVAHCVSCEKASVGLFFITRLTNSRYHEVLLLSCWMILCWMNPHGQKFLRMKTEKQTILPYHNRFVRINLQGY